MPWDPENRVLQALEEVDVLPMDERKVLGDLEDVLQGRL
jgi:hypothetical protein